MFYRGVWSHEEVNNKKVNIFKKHIFFSNHLILLVPFKYKYFFWNIKLFVLQVNVRFQRSDVIHWWTESWMIYLENCAYLWPENSWLRPWKHSTFYEPFWLQVSSMVFKIDCLGLIVLFVWIKVYVKLRKLIFDHTQKFQVRQVDLTRMEVNSTVFWSVEAEKNVFARKFYCLY